MENENIKQLFERFGLVDFYDDLQKLDSQSQHDQEWLNTGLYAPMIDSMEFDEFYLKLIYEHNLADVNTYINEFPNAERITYAPCLAVGSHALQLIKINDVEFAKNKDSYRMFIMDYVEENLPYDYSNFDIFIDRLTAGRSVDWNQYLHNRLQSRFFPQEIDFEVFEEFEDVLFSQKLGSQMCFPMSHDEFFILSGMGVLFSEDFYVNIFKGSMSISNKHTENYIMELMKIGLDPYEYDADYKALHYKFLPDPTFNKANSHLGLPKLNAFLQTIPFFRVLGTFQ